MKVIANRQLRGEYGLVAADQEFECREEVAIELLRASMVRHALPPRVEYETKVIVPMQAPQVVSTREPFRNGALSDAKQTTMDSEGNRVISSSNLFASGTADSRGRGRRSGSRS